MKRLIPILLIAVSIRLPAQISEGGFPLTYHIPALKNATNIPVYNMQAMDVDQLIKEDQANSSIPERYAIFEKVNINIKDKGLYNESEEYHGKIWRYQVAAANAKSIQLVFSEFVIPEGATLFVYDESYYNIYGAFTHKNMADDHAFIIADLNSDHIIIEYFEPFDAEGESNIVIGMIGQAYKDIFKSTVDDNGFLGINCYDGKDFQNEKHSVCRITFIIGSSGYLCTGSLINNVHNDGTPYFLTAHHCISDSAVAQSMVAYFNYESATCEGTTPINHNSLSGASLLSKGSKSDYSLLLLSDTPPQHYKPFYAGWDLLNTQDTSSASIHHPNGKVKKISIDYAPPVSYDETIWWGSSNYSPANSHWVVQFDLGKTSSGSSGAPLFNKDAKIIGQLHGGDDYTDYYGKLNYSWTQSSTGYETMKSFLDPDDTDTTSLDGYYPADNLPDAQFFTAFNMICQYEPVALLNSSAFDIQSWQWTISPATISYLNGTDASSENPVISFDAPGSYAVELSVENSSGSDIIAKNGFLTAGVDLTPEIIPINKIDSCLCKFDSLSVMARGALTYSWSLSEPTKENFFLSDTASPVTVINSYDEILNDTITGLSVYLTGYHGSCADSVELIYPLISQPNDHIMNALPLEMGINGPFSNKCASAQEFEPIPPHYSCTDQLSWCNEVGVDIVSNSVWFYFTAPPSGIVSISSEGFDNEIAVYNATSWEDILIGKYDMIAANDDRTFRDYDPLIKGASVIPGNIYWVQVDGSAGGSEGTFYLELDDEIVTTDRPNSGYSALQIYPQPAGERINIESTEFLSVNQLTLDVYTITGTPTYSMQYTGPLESPLTINTKNWISGVYIIRIVCDGKILYGKIVK